MKIQQKLREELGQTAIEYLLLLVVAIGLGVAFYKKMDEYLIKSPNSIIGNQLNSFKRKLESDSTGRYRYYALPRRKQN